MHKKQTKIVATISDRRCDPEFIESIYRAGVDVIRLNTAHQGPKESWQVIHNIRQVSDRLAILVDTKGPELRVTQTADDLLYQKGEKLKIFGTATHNISTKEKIYINYADFHKDIPKNTTIFIDDGQLEIKVEKKTTSYLLCRVLNDGVIKSNKSVNVPGIHLNLPTISKKDKEYINFAIKNKVDFIAHSFVRNKADVLAIQKMLDKHQSQMKVIAKIENLEGVENIDEILECAHGIMIARGDLGIELAAEEIPLIQKEIIRKCIMAHKPVIVATQMLQSMVHSPRPTRAEVSDVANAVIDGADAVMLSEESAGGRYPLESVEFMSRIVRRVEISNEKNHFSNLPNIDTDDKVAHYLIKSAIEASKELDIKEIIMTSTGGFSAQVIASYRGRTPVYVKCFDYGIARQLALSYGINAHYVKKEENYKKFLATLFRYLVKKSKLAPEDRVIFLARAAQHGSGANFMEICQVQQYLKK